MSDLTRAVLNALLPPGQLWVPKENDDFDLLLDGIGDNHEVIRTFLSGLAYLRDPQLTTILADLEKEYGVLPNTDLTDQERRDRLKVQKNDRISDGSPSFLEEKLQASGFDLFVYQNDPPVDPALFSASLYQMYAGGFNAYAGRPDAYASAINSSLVVNGDVYKNGPVYTVLAGDPNSSAGHETAYAGNFSFEQNLIEYSIPTNSDYWHLVFFVGGAVTRDPITDEITTLDPAIVPISRRQELIKLILKYKPMHSWALIKVFFT